MIAPICAAAAVGLLPGGSQAGSGGAVDTWARLHRPLHSPGGNVRCPVTAPVDAHALPASVRQPGTRLFGAGPVYLQLSTARGPGVLDMRYSGTRNGLRGQKTPWLMRPGYRGPLLIRAWRLDGAGTTMLSIATDQQFELRIPWSKLSGRSDASGWRGFPSSTWVSGPGCRVWQVDGLTFSETIVAHVRW